MEACSDEAQGGELTIAIKQWWPVGSTHEQYLEDMRETGAWGSEEYFAWKQRRINDAFLREKDFVSPDFKTCPDVFYYGWEVDYNLADGQDDKLRAMMTNEPKDYPWVINYPKRGVTTLHRGSCYAAGKTAKWVGYQDWKAAHAEAGQNCLVCKAYSRDLP